MMPYPARDGHPSMFEANAAAGSAHRKIAMRKLVALTAVTALVTLTVVAAIESLAVVAPTTAPCQTTGISPEEIQREIDGNRLPVTVVDQPY